mmetsp:Transcript_110224/g.267987  ORF Transcript_110224/g.267987 Transcript_110224/m.267987 type:complete len:203 (+) Transcript_110224:595-1203(+)
MVVAVARATALRTVVTTKTSIALAALPIACATPTAVARARGMAAVQSAPSYCAEARALEARSPVKAVVRATAVVAEETRFTLAKPPNAWSADTVARTHKLRPCGIHLKIVRVLVEHTSGALLDLARNTREPFVAIAVLGLKGRLDALSAPAALAWAAYELDTAVDATKTRLAIALAVNSVARALVALDTTRLLLAVRAGVAW